MPITREYVKSIEVLMSCLREIGGDPLPVDKRQLLQGNVTKKNITIQSHGHSFQLDRVDVDMPKFKFGSMISWFKASFNRASASNISY